MKQAIDYQANFCDENSKCKVIRPEILSGVEKPCNCPRDKGCSYPLIKETQLYNIFNQKASFKIDHYLITLDVEDKFNITYPDQSNYQCTLWLNDKKFCDFTVPCTSNRDIIEYTFSNNQDFSSIFSSDNIKVKCKLLINETIVICPKFLNIIIFE